MVKPLDAQGTYLPAKIGLDLEEMQHYQSLRDMGKQVKNLYEKLHLQHDLLRSQNPTLVHRQSQDSTAMSQRLSARIESISGWKYAPAPLKLLRSQATGEELTVIQCDLQLRMHQCACCIR